MTSLAHRKHVAPWTDGAAAGGHVIAAAARVLRRVVDAIGASRQRQAERDIARVVAARGGRITDDLEREMTRRLTASDWSPRG
jgi:hypothetical protein